MQPLPHYVNEEWAIQNIVSAQSGSYVREDLNGEVITSPDIPEILSSFDEQSYIITLENSAMWVSDDQHAEPDLEDMEKEYLEKLESEKQREQREREKQARDRLEKEQTQAEEQSANRKQNKLPETGSHSVLGTAIPYLIAGLGLTVSSCRNSYKNKSNIEHI